jgi:hypothetical protein
MHVVISTACQGFEIHDRRIGKSILGCDWLQQPELPMTTAFLVILINYVSAWLLLNFDGLHWPVEGIRHCDNGAN